MLKLDPKLTLNQIALEIKSNSKDEKFFECDIINNLKFFEYEHIERCFSYLKHFKINENSSVFEIGPGACYFLYFCRAYYKCKIHGLDLRSDLFRRARKLMNIEVMEGAVNAFKPIPFPENNYDYIVSMLTMFNSGWGVSAHRYWLNDCKQHLNKDGCIFIHFNRTTFHDEITSIYEKVGTKLDEFVYMIKRDLI